MSLDAIHPSAVGAFITLGGCCAISIAFILQLHMRRNILSYLHTQLDIKSKYILDYRAYAHKGQFSAEPSKVDPWAF